MKALVLAAGKGTRLRLFLDAAQRLGVLPQACAVFEDSRAGVEAGLSAGMLVVGIGDS